MSKKIIIFLLFIGFVLFGCGKRSIIQKYYLIEPPTAVDTLSNNGNSITEDFCEINPTEIAPAFATHKIAVRSKTHQISYFYYHKWAVTPRQAVTDFIERRISGANIFKRTGVDIWKFNPKYQIRSKVNVLEFREKGGNAAAHLQAVIWLFDKDEKANLLVHNFDRTVLLQQKKLNNFSKAISELLHQEINVFINKVKRLLKESKTE